MYAMFSTRFSCGLIGKMARGVALAAALAFAPFVQSAPLLGLTPSQPDILVSDLALLLTGGVEAGDAGATFTANHTAGSFSRPLPASRTRSPSVRTA